MWAKPTKRQLAAIPRFGEQFENPDLATGDIMIYLHFFLGACDWYIAEYDGEDTFYGFACLGDKEMAEWGNISFSELQTIKVNGEITDAETIRCREIPSVIEIEVDCDRYWTPRKFSEIAKEKGYRL